MMEQRDILCASECATTWLFDDGKEVLHAVAPSTYQFLIAVRAGFSAIGRIVEFGQDVSFLHLVPVSFLFFLACLRVWHEHGTRISHVRNMRSFKSLK